MARIGFYGGCFNPPTKAHIELAKKAQKECNLDKVIFVPVGDLYQKVSMAKAIDRYNMLQIVCSEENKLQVSDIEIKSNKNYKAIDIFKILNDEHKEDENFFIMGTDNLKNIKSWKQSEELIHNFNYIILDRGLTEANSVIENDELLKNNRKRFTVIRNDKFNNCSSTDIRTKIKNGEKPENLDNKIYEYILENNIY